MGIEPPLSRAVALTFVPKQKTHTLRQRLEGHPLVRLDEPRMTLAVKHVTKSLGDEYWQRSR